MHSRSAFMRRLPTHEYLRATSQNYSLEPMIPETSRVAECRPQATMLTLCSGVEQHNEGPIDILGCFARFQSLVFPVTITNIRVFFMLKNGFGTFRIDTKILDGETANILAHIDNGKVTLNDSWEQSPNQVFFPVVHFERPGKCDIIVSADDVEVGRASFWLLHVETS